MVGEKGRVSLLFPEIPELLRQLAEENIQPGATLELVEQNPDEVVVRVDGELVSLPSRAAETVWIQEVCSVKHGSIKGAMRMQLIDLEPGEKALIRRLEGGRSLLSRLATLGFTPGAPVTVVRRGEHGPMLVSLRGSRVALGREEAAHVLVTAQLDERPVVIRETDQRCKILALAGQPNVGKSTVFNMLTGLNQHVGNWTGKTVDLKMGEFAYKNTHYEIYDLPGTYGLTAGSEEERLARDFIIQQHPDLIIAVVDAATLERNLYLVAELLLLPAPVILALNMIDVAEQEGIQIEPKVLESALGIPVVPMAASRNQGCNELQETARRMLNGEISLPTPAALDPGGPPGGVGQPQRDHRELCAGNLFDGMGGAQAAGRG